MKRRLAIGPANHAGQAFEWCRSVRTELGVRAAAFGRTDFGLRRGSRFKFPLDLALPHHRVLPGSVDRLVMSRFLRSFSHVALDGFLSPIGPPRSPDGLRRAIDELRNAGQHVALIAHGSDVRDPARHLAEIAGSYFGAAPKEWVATLEQTAARNRELASQFDVVKLVSTPDLLIDLPDAHWLPVAADLARWRTIREIGSSGRIKVLHMPSRRVPPIKGTAVIDPVLRKFHEKGRIEYICPEVQVPHAAMVELVRQADVVVDQIGTGFYGVASAEAMAAGRLVVGDLSGQVRSAVPDVIPILDAPPDAFEDVMAGLVCSREEWLPLASAGRIFAERWHSGAASARVLNEFLSAA